jgi:hypothetical protein
VRTVLSGSSPETHVAATASPDQGITARATVEAIISGTTPDDVAAWPPKYVIGPGTGANLGVLPMAGAYPIRASAGAHEVAPTTRHDHVRPWCAHDPLVGFGPNDRRRTSMAAGRLRNASTPLLDRPSRDRDAAEPNPDSEHNGRDQDAYCRTHRAILRKAYRRASALREKQK